MWQKNLALNLVIGFFLLLFALYILMLGLFIGPLLEEIYPDRNKLDLFNGILLYYFLADLLIRFMMQSLPRLTIESFIHLPIRKSTLIHYMECRTIFDIFNLIPLLLFFPATFTMVMPTVGPMQAFFWITSLFAMVLANNFLATYLKRLMGTKPVFIAFIGIALVILVILDKKDIISLSSLSVSILGFFLSQPLFIIFPLSWMIFTYMLQYRFLKVHLYPDEMQVRRTTEIRQDADNGYLRSLGITGSIIAMEIKLYLRNKRTKTMLYLLPVFLLYGFFFYPNKIYLSQDLWLMFVGVFMTGGFMLNYANYAFGYESSYFDALMTKNISFNHYIRVKFYVSVMISAACFILTIPYLFYGIKVLLINAAMFLYNIGILSFILLYFATFNKKRIDLTRGGAFNYQGIGAMNWLAIFPAFLLPIIIALPFKLTGYPNIGIIVTGVLGIVGLLFSGFLLNRITRNFYKRKYIMAAGFREK